MKRAFAYRTEQRKRQENQDSFGVFQFDGFLLAIVCDGMGGHVGGAQASALAVRTVHQVMSKADGSDAGEALRRALEQANQVIYEAARKNHRLMGMGTTAVAAALTDDGYVHIAHVGDSRAYLINEGQAIQVTRDHTMVNLFVDAELLTPEDAATHPEAHVLSRSLGVERQVEVELSAPIELADADVVFLCSDGVHGVVTDWELGSVAWEDTSAALDHVLDIVEAREGDDNATAVSVRIGEGASMQPTGVPEPRSIEESMGANHGATIVPEDFGGLYEEESDPDSEGTEPSAPPRSAAPPALLPEHDDSTDPEPTPPSPVRPQPVAPVDLDKPTPRPVARKAPPAKEAAAKKKKGSSRMVLVLGGAVVASVLGLGLVYLLTRPPAETGGTTLIANNDVTDPDPVAPVAPTPVAPAPQEEFFFKVEALEAPRRLPHRALRYTQPPPGGQPQFLAVSAAREKECGKSLDYVWDAMEISPDYAQLYSQAWLCFNSVHAAPLHGARIREARRFGDLETHFRGWPPPGEPEIDWTDAAKRMPLWFRPALGGVEYRLEAWARSTDDDRMRKVMVDLKGEPTVTDELAADLWVEVGAAQALAAAEELDEALEEAWARRVFVIASAMEGRVGVLLRTHRPELVPRIEAALKEVTEGDDVPKDVVTALKVARGEMDPPHLRKAAPQPQTVKPTLKEPDLDGSHGGGTNNGVIHR